jgi:hypothetical protein
MIILVAFLYVIPPVTLGRYPSRQQCELDRASVQSIGRLAAQRMTRLLIALGLGLALGACSKCDVPTWMPNAPAPHSCHDGPSPQ